MQYTNNTVNVSIMTPGEFSVYNALAVFSVCDIMSVGVETTLAGLDSSSVRGRFEVVDAFRDRLFVIDYAHNEVSMESVLSALKQYPHKRLICLFGSVGGRTVSRRSELSKVCAKYCDFCIVTSDNPNFEEPEAIIADIEKALQKSGCDFISFVDRGDAIEYAVENSKEGDIVVFAGKGHEDFQLINGQRVYFCEKEIITKTAEKLKSSI